MVLQLECPVVLRKGRGAPNVVAYSCGLYVLCTLSLYTTVRAWQALNPVSRCQSEASVRTCACVCWMTRVGTGAGRDSNVCQVAARQHPCKAQDMQRHDYCLPLRKTPPPTRVTCVTLCAVVQALLQLR